MIELILLFNAVTFKASLTYGVPVERIFVNKVAFAALVDGGGVITWGDAAGGGDSSAVAAELATGVHSIYATDRVRIALVQRWFVVIEFCFQGGVGG